MKNVQDFDAIKRELLRTNPKQKSENPIQIEPVSELTLDTGRYQTRRGSQIAIRFKHSATKDLEQLVTVQEAATFLRVHRQTIYRWIYTKALPSFTVRGGRRIKLAAIQELVKAYE